MIDPPGDETGASDRPRPGVVDLVGAGPGDPGLLTRRGAEALAGAEVVVYDHLVSPRLLDLAPPACLRIFAGKSAGRCALRQPEINDLLVEHARSGRRVVRLKGGDPYVFGRGAEEAGHLAAAGIPFRVVPGVTAGVGVTAYAGLPITHRGDASAVAFVTGHVEPNSADSRVDWAGLAAFPGTLVVYMGVGRLRSICVALIDAGKPADTPAAAVQSGTLPGQRTVASTLADLPDRVAGAGLGPPALLVVGAIVRRRPDLDWFERRPLFGRRVVVTRPEGDGDSATARLEALGAEVLRAPMVAIRPPDDFGPLDDALGRLAAFDWIAFTSPHGVRHFLDRLAATGSDLRALGRARLAAIGPSTAAALAEYRLRADLVPDDHRSEGLADALAPVVAGGRVLLARADRGRTLLQEQLSGSAIVEQVAVYRNVDAEALPSGVADRLAEGSIDWITLTSPAIARRLHALIPEAARSRIGGPIRLASLSPVTTAAAASVGWPIAAEAAEYTWDGLIDALVAAEARGRPDQETIPS